jgi:hypothetical protein
VFKNKEVNVRFIDIGTGQVFAESRVPIEMLPETFQLQTTMHLGDEDWTVVRAEPDTSAAFATLGQLTLTLSRVQMLPTKDILFSLPTISDEIASVSQIAKSGYSVLEMHEDDWRQIEFVSSRLSARVDAEIAEIRAVIEAGFSRPGFEKCHVRSSLPIPLEGVPFDAVASIFSRSMDQLDGVCYFQYPGLISDGFAFRSDDLNIYGVQSDGMVSVLGLIGISVSADDLENRVGQFHALMIGHDLLLVDWCRAQVVPADAVAIRQYLQS